MESFCFKEGFFVVKVKKGSSIVLFFFVWKNIMSAFSIKLESYYSKEVLKAI